MDFKWLNESEIRIEGNRIELTDFGTRAAVSVVTKGDSGDAILPPACFACC